jgi:hypothetical protein
MANLQEQAAWEEGVYQIEQTDPVVGGPDGISNIQAKQLANRTRWLREGLEEAQEDLQAVGISGQNAIWAAVERAISEIGLLSQELERQQTVRHQEGCFMITNRGVKRGCSVTKSTTANRNISLSSGTIFMHGQEMPVSAQDNAASVPSNSGSEPGSAQVYLALHGGSVVVGVTGLNESAPDDALVLDDLSIPAGSTGTNAPYLEDVTISRVARTEPEWPVAQLSAAQMQVDFPRPMASNDYHITLDVVGFSGGDNPALVHHEEDRASNTFRAYLLGSADSVRVRYVAHLMNQ